MKNKGGMENIEIGTLEWFNIKNLNDVTHRVTSMHIDIHNSQVSLIIEKGTIINSVNLSLQQSKEIGLINFDALKLFCK